MSERQADTEIPMGRRFKTADIRERKAEYGEMERDRKADSWDGANQLLFCAVNEEQRGDCFAVAPGGPGWTGDILGVVQELGLCSAGGDSGRPERSNIFDHIGAAQEVRAKVSDSGHGP